MANKQQRNRQAQQMKTAYRKGASIRDIAARTGQSYGTVHNRLSQASTRMRSRGGPNHVKH